MKSTEAFKGKQIEVILLLKDFDHPFLLQDVVYVFPCSHRMTKSSINANKAEHIDKDGWLCAGDCTGFFTAKSFEASLLIHIIHAEANLNFFIKNIKKTKEKVLKC